MHNLVYIFIIISIMGKVCSEQIKIQPSTFYSKFGNTYVTTRRQKFDEDYEIIT